MFSIICLYNFLLQKVFDLFSQFYLSFASSTFYILLLSFLSLFRLCTKKPFAHKLSLVLFVYLVCTYISYFGIHREWRLSFSLFFFWIFITYFKFFFYLLLSINYLCKTNFTFEEYLFFILIFSFFTFNVSLWSHDFLLHGFRLHFILTFDIF